jgi:hypothetical protein
MFGERHLLAMAAERDCQDTLRAILTSQVSRLLGGSMTEKMPYVASMNVLPSLLRWPNILPISFLIL